jgi:hypothetical protein
MEKFSNRSPQLCMKTLSGEQYRYISNTSFVAKSQSLALMAILPASYGKTGLR